MNTSVKISAHKNGTFSLNNLTWDELNAISHMAYGEYKRQRNRKDNGEKLNALCEHLIQFGDELSDVIVAYETK